MWKARPFQDLEGSHHVPEWSKHRFQRHQIEIPVDTDSLLRPSQSIGLMSSTPDRPGVIASPAKKLDSASSSRFRARVDSSASLEAKTFPLASGFLQVSDEDNKLESVCSFSSAVLQSNRCSFAFCSSVSLHSSVRCR